jgi:hypothetical protein
VQTRVAAYDALWTASYRQSGPKRTDDGSSKYLYYGDSGSSFNGNNRSAFGFNYASIASELAGSTLQKVRLNLTNVHAYWDNGVDIYFGIHNFAAEPASWAGGGIPRSKIAHAHFGKPQNKWVNLPLDFAKAIRDGWGKGIVLEAPNSSREFYGFASGIGSGYAIPRIEFTYVK